MYTYVHSTYHLLISYESYFFFLYEFCSSDISKTESTIIFTLQYPVHYQESKTSLFQCAHSSMTSSRRHFHSYFHNHSIINCPNSVQINFRPLAKIQTIHISVRVTTRTCARVKILKCSKSHINNFEYEPGHLEHFKIFRPHLSTRALCARTARGKVKILIFCKISIPLTIIYNFHSFAFTLDLS